MDRKEYKDIQKSASSNNAKDLQTKERLNAFIGNIHDGIYETDGHGNFTYFNKALCRILGFPEEEIPGQNFSHFMDKENARKTILLMEHPGSIGSIRIQLGGSQGKLRLVKIWHCIVGKLGSWLIVPTEQCSFERYVRTFEMGAA
jgi:PAS domain-containing protein